MKLQLTPTRKLDDALTVWHEPMPEVDVVIDPRKGLPFRAGSITDIYAFDVLGHMPFQEIPALLKQWANVLKKGGILYVIEPDYEYLLRSGLTSDLTIEQFNSDFIRQCYLNKDLLCSLLQKAGFPQPKQRIWFDGLKFQREHYQIIFSGEKAEL